MDKTILITGASRGIGVANEYVDYAASKAAVDALTIGLEKEVAAVLWLLSDEASYATGTFIDVSGGR